VVGVEHHHFIENVSASLAGEIEIGMIGEVDGCVLVSGGAIVNLAFVLVVQCVSDGDLERPGITLFAVGTRVLQNYPNFISAL
jgi:hypothetical protein